MHYAYDCLWEKREFMGTLNLWEKKENLREKMYIEYKICSFFF